MPPKRKPKKTKYDEQGSAYFVPRRLRKSGEQFYEGTQPKGYPTKEQLERWRVPSSNELQRFFKQRKEEAEQLLKRIETEAEKLKPTELDELAEKQLKKQSPNGMALRMNRVFVEIARVKAADLYEGFARGELTIEQLFEELKKRGITYP